MDGVGGPFFFFFFLTRANYHQVCSERLVIGNWGGGRSRARFAQPRRRPSFWVRGTSYTTTARQHQGRYEVFSFVLIWGREVQWGKSVFWTMKNGKFLGYFAVLRLFFALLSL